MATVAKMTVRVNADTNQAAKALDKLRGNVGNLENALNKSSTAMDRWKGKQAQVFKTDVLRAYRTELKSVKDAQVAMLKQTEMVTGSMKGQAVAIDKVAAAMKVYNAEVVKSGSGPTFGQKAAGAIGMAGRTIKTGGQIAAAAAGGFYAGEKIKGAAGNLISGGESGPGGKKFSDLSFWEKQAYLRETINPWGLSKDQANKKYLGETTAKRTQEQIDYTERKRQESRDKKVSESGLAGKFLRQSHLDDRNLAVRNSVFKGKFGSAEAAKRTDAEYEERMLYKNFERNERAKMFRGKFGSREAAARTDLDYERRRGTYTPRPEERGLNQILEAGTAEGYSALRANKRGAGKMPENIEKMKVADEKRNDILQVISDKLVDNGTETLALPS